MRGDTGFVNIMLDNTNKIYQVSLKQFDWWKKVQGTECQVVRIKENSSYKTVFGSIANSTLPDDEDAEKFPYVILINMNDMKRLFQKAVDPLQFYDNQQELKLGDILIFSRYDQEFKWKITEIQTFSETANVLNQYTITGLVEVNSLK
jgi:hypothetical protein